MADSIGKLSPKEAEKLVRDIAALGSIIPSPHCLKRMRERDIDFQDIEVLLRGCEISDLPEYDQDHQDWKYKAKGFLIDGSKAVAITIIVSHRELFLVTVYCNSVEW